MSKTLDEAINDANIERVQRYPLTEIPGTADEIKILKEIAENASPYVHELNPNIVAPKPWQMVIHYTMEIMRSVFGYLNRRKTTDFQEIYIDLGTLMRVSVAYGQTKTADKVGTLNPVITVKSDMAYDHRSDPYYDSMSTDMANDLREIGMEYLHPMFYDTRVEMKEILNTAAENIQLKWGAKIADPDCLSYVLVAFFRKAKEYFVEHKDGDDGYGVEVSLGRLICMGIEKQKDGNYFIYVSPAQEFKMENAKGDDKSEMKEYVVS